MLHNQLTEQKECIDCKKQFMSAFLRGAWLARCPSCADIKQKRPSIIRERNLLSSYECFLGNLPKSWERYQADKKDLTACWRIVLKGSAWGAAWSGRIDIFSHDIVPPKAGDFIIFEHLESVHYKEKGNLNILDRREYIRVSKNGMPNSEIQYPNLVWHQCRTKTTLKGLGRQYKYAIDGSPIWEKRIAGGVRSGRSYIEGCLAIADDDHPVVIKEIFNH